MIDESALNVGRYQAFADVTSLVQSGGAGTYFGANVQAGRSSDHYAGWSLVVAYRDTSAAGAQPDDLRRPQDDPLRRTRPTTITVSGFRTPPNGAVNSNVGFITYEGDLGIVGDTAAAERHDALRPDQPGVELLQQLDRAEHAQPVATSNNFGFDADIFQTTNVLGNNATSATLRLTTSGDQYLPGALFFATELYAPKITQTKIGHRPERRRDPARRRPRVHGHQHELQRRRHRRRDRLRPARPDPQQHDLRPGLARGSTAPAAPTPPATTPRNFDGPLNRIEARLGTGATASAGGRLAPGASSEVRFRVTVGNPLPDDRIIRNNATASFFSESVGTPLTATSSANKQVGAPDLAIEKRRTSAARSSPASTVDYEIEVKNVGDATTLGTVTVTDTLPGRPHGRTRSRARAGRARSPRRCPRAASPARAPTRSLPAPPTR